MSLIHVLDLCNQKDYNRNQKDYRATSMNPEKLLFGKTRAAILALLYGHADESFYLRQIVRMSDCGLGPVQRELKHLAASGLITRRVSGHQVYFQANHESPLFPEIKSLMAKTAEPKIHLIGSDDELKRLGKGYSLMDECNDRRS
ncbi:MAG: hypothetical protein SCM96_15740 [Acidobacteriota bacterium]|nr:hypothetical protein [Acidobacteriota bacterium]